MEQLKSKLMENPEFRAEWDKYDLSWEIALAIMEGRIKKGWTQKQLADAVGTKQPAIARIENESGLPSLTFLLRIAEALEIEIPLSVGRKLRISKVL